jgi:biopolymer transport protein ExbB/TolQ
MFGMTFLELRVANIPSPLIVALLILSLLSLAAASLQLRTYRRRLHEIEELQRAAEQMAAGFELRKPDGSPADAAYERMVRNTLAHAITLSYEHEDGTSSEVTLEPTSVESIENFLKTIREEDVLRGRRGESAAPAR